MGPLLDLGDEALAALIEDRRRATAGIAATYEFDRCRRTGGLLEVCWGPGIGLAWLRDECGWDVRGVEPGRELVDFARERLGLDVTCGLLQDLDEPSRVIGGPSWGLGPGARDRRDARAPSKPDLEAATGCVHKSLAAGIISRSEA